MHRFDTCRKHAYSWTQSLVSAQSPQAKRALIKPMLPSKINSLRLNCCFLSDHTKVWVSPYSTHSYPTGVCWVSAHMPRWLNPEQGLSDEACTILNLHWGPVTFLCFRTCLPAKLSLVLSVLSFWRTLMKTIYCCSLSRNLFQWVWRVGYYFKSIWKSRCSLHKQGMFFSSSNTTG